MVEANNGRGVYIFQSAVCLCGGDDDFEDNPQAHWKTLSLQVEV